MSKLLLKIFVIFAISFTHATLDVSQNSSNMFWKNDTSGIVKKIMTYLHSHNVSDWIKNSKNYTSFLTHSSLACFESFTELSYAELGSYIDASGKLPSGIALGAINWIGSYTECLNNLNAHFCTMSNILLSGKSPMQLGLCVPKVCQAEDITAVLKFILPFTKIGNKTILQVFDNNRYKTSYGGDTFCTSKDTNYTDGVIVMMVISSIILGLCLFGTIVDILHKFIAKHQGKKYVLYVEEDSGKNTNTTDEKTEITMHLVKSEEIGSKVLQFFTCFSLVKNTKAILNTDIPAGAITSVNGIRVFSIVWVILGHTLIFDMITFDDALIVVSWLPRFTMQALLNAMVSVDTFFLLSGLLVGYLCMRRFNKTGSLPLLRYYLHRYIRLTPSYLYMMLFLAFLYPNMSDGPFWFTQGTKTTQSKSCISYWWTNILYINNFYPELTDMCANWSWYLANDMQFYVISPIILWCMHRFQVIGTAVSNGLLLIACFIVNGVLMHKYDASPVLSATNPMQSSTLDYMQYIYMKPYTRISPYLVGLVLGYILANKKCSLSGPYKYLINSFGWLVAVGMGVGVVYGPYSTTYHTWTDAETYTYGITFRFFWAIAVAWVIFACHEGYGGLVNDLMSWKAYIPLSRLTYATYLVHPMVINIFFASSKVAIHMTLMNYAYYFVSITVLSFAAAFVLSVCIEFPVFNLEKMIFNF